jgi:hypothetical protein
MGQTRGPETSVNNYHTTPCNYPKDHRLQNVFSGTESRKTMAFYASYLKSQVGMLVTLSLLQLSCKTDYHSHKPELNFGQHLHMEKDHWFRNGNAII